MSLFDLRRRELVFFHKHPALALHLRLPTKTDLLKDILTSQFIDWQDHAWHIFRPNHQKSKNIARNDINIIDDEVQFLLPSYVYMNVTTVKNFTFGDSPHIECQLRFAQARDYLTIIRTSVAISKRLSESNKMFSKIMGNKKNDKLEYLSQYYLAKASMHAEGYQHIREALLALGVQDHALNVIHLRRLVKSEPTDLLQEDTTWMWKSDLGNGRSDNENILQDVHEGEFSLVYALRNPIMYTPTNNNMFTSPSKRVATFFRVYFALWTGNSSGQDGHAALPAQPPCECSCGPFRTFDCFTAIYCTDD